MVNTNKKDNKIKTFNEICHNNCDKVDVLKLLYKSFRMKSEII